MRNYLKIVGALTLLVTVHAFASTTTPAVTNVAPAIDIIKNFSAVIQAVKKQSPIPVLFPTQNIPVPKNVEHLYASYDSYAAHPDYNKFWIINADATADCKGTRVCNIGFVSAEKSAKLVSSYMTLPENKSHKKPQLLLENGYVAYYTPFHIEAGAVNPTLEWQVNDVLYTLRWQVQARDSEKLLVAMANSAINPTASN